MQAGAMTAAPNRCAAHNCGEVVISQDHVTGFLGDFCASDSHGHPNVCQLQGWRIIHSIPCHSHNVAHIPQKANNILRKQQPWSTL